MDPISMMQAGIQIAGMATSFFGAKAAAATANKIADANRVIGYDELAENSLRQQQATLTYQRQQTENLRNVQRAKSAGLVAATSSGAQFGSGLAGGQAAAEDMGSYNSLNLSQNYTIGQGMFSLDADISKNRINLAGLQGQEMSQEAQVGLGASITKAAPAASSFLGTVGSWMGQQGGPRSGGILGWR